MGHYTVYLPAYDDKKLIGFFSNFKNVQWQIFSKHTKKPYVVNNCNIQPISTNKFTTSFTTCEGILCGPGFETPAEALYMGKKLMIIPMKNQYEQHCNAAGAAELGVPVIKKLKKKYIYLVNNWINDSKAIQVNYKDETNKIIDQVLAHTQNIQSLKLLNIYYFLMCLPYLQGAVYNTKAAVIYLPDHRW